MYDPITARFLQEDTYRGQYKDPLSLNLYTYCHNEPLRYNDPTGHRYVVGMDPNSETERERKQAFDSMNSERKKEKSAPNNKGEERANNRDNETFGGIAATDGGQSRVNAVKDFVQGFAQTADSNAFGGLFKADFDLNTTAFYYGLLAGDIVTTVQGLYELYMGLNCFGGGIILDATGVGAIAGVAVSAAGVAIVAHGVATVAISATNFGKDLSNITIDSGTDGAGKSNSLTDKPGKIANETGRTTKEVNQAIEQVKQGGSWRTGTNNRNPDVMVDTQTGEVYPKTPNGGIGDSIGNIFDYLP